MTPLPAAQALDQFFLEARCKLLDLAAILDRIDRGENAAAAATDPRVGRIREALTILLNKPAARAEQIQQVFSQSYDPSWKRPDPR
jgi:hypothetical protein